jgi:hypothetical protein
MGVIKDPSHLLDVERQVYHGSRPGFRIAELTINPTQKVPWHCHSNFTAQSANREKSPKLAFRSAVLIFRWTGWRKSEHSDMRSRLQHAPINSRPATTLLLFKVRRQVRLQAESTVQSANREKSSKLAFEPDETGSPVDPWVPDSGQMRVFNAEKKRILKTENSLAERDGFEPSVPIVHSLGERSGLQLFACSTRGLRTVDDTPPKFAERRTSVHAGCGLARTALRSLRARSARAAT